MQNYFLLIFSLFLTFEFIVEKDGSISSIQINENKLGCAQMVNEAIRVLMLMPKWIPGEVEGVKKEYL